MKVAIRVVSVWNASTQQVEHQLGVLGVLCRHAHRLLDGRQLTLPLGFGGLNAALDVANGIEVLVNLSAIARPQRPIAASIVE
jgi:hypothetical protein